MKIGTLINLLIELKKQNGNLEVWAGDDYGFGGHVQHASLCYPEYGRGIYLALPPGRSCSSCHRGCD